MTTGNHQDGGRTPIQKVGAVVLAAGRSSRMGTSKALLPLNGVTALERVFSSLRGAGVGQIVVVTGHEPDALVPVLDRLDADRAHNFAYQTGMFSSVQAGVAALHGEIQSFFVQPVDCPLVPSRVLSLLLAAMEQTGKDIVYPVCCGRRGHPPLLSARHIPGLLAADARGSLETFLAGFSAEQVTQEISLDVRDLTVLMDMDTDGEYRALSHLAAILDAAAAGQTRIAAAQAEVAAGPAQVVAARPDRVAAPAEAHEARLTNDDALYLLSAAAVPGNIKDHCRRVASVGQCVAEAVAPHVPGLDIDLVRAGCLLHDLARLHPDHARLAGQLLANLGLPRLGGVVAEHMVIAPELPRSAGVTEPELVYLADKMVAGDEVVGLDEREARTLRKVRPGPAAARRIRNRIDDARLIAAKVEALVGRRIEDIVSEAGTVEAGAGGAAANVLRVYLVRHAQADGPGEGRFLGQADPPLSSAGIEQARVLAGTLMEMTGGACFDAIYCSDLQRAVRTAEIVADACGSPTWSDARLREIDVGLWEGLTWEEARLAYPFQHQERERDLTGTAFPEGESFEDLQARVVAGFFDLLRDNIAAGRRRVLIVGHKGVDRVILANVLGLPLEEAFSLQNDYCSVCVLRVTKDIGGAIRVTVED